MRSPVTGHRGLGEAAWSAAAHAAHTGVAARRRDTWAIHIWAFPSTSWRARGQQGADPFRMWSATSRSVRTEVADQDADSW